MKNETRSLKLLAVSLLCGVLLACIGCTNAMGGESSVLESKDAVGSCSATLNGGGSTGSKVVGGGSTGGNFTPSASYAVPFQVRSLPGASSHGGSVRSSQPWTTRQVGRTVSTVVTTTSVSVVAVASTSNGSTGGTASRTAAYESVRVPVLVVQAAPPTLAQQIGLRMAKRPKLGSRAATVATALREARDERNR